MKLSSYTEIGKRELNEDFISHRSGIYVLCDGVGGEEKGEVASRFVAEKLTDCFGENDGDLIVKALIQNALKRIQLELNARIASNPEELGMGTTLTAALFSKGKAFLIHIGDSRIYYIRPSEDIFWRTTDHSVTAELVMSGMISEEEARNHPMRNRITRAIQSNIYGKTSKADINCVPNIKVGDLIFLCSDGVLETFSESDLLEILVNQQNTIDEKIIEIKRSCMGISNDNNSALLIEVEPEDEILTNQGDEIDWQKIKIFGKESLDDKNMEFQSNGPVNIICQKPDAVPRSVNFRIFNIASIAIATFLILIIATYTFTFCQRHKTIRTKSSDGSKSDVTMKQEKRELKTSDYLH